MRIAGIDFEDSVTLNEVISVLNSKGIYDINYISSNFNRLSTETNKINQMSAQELIEIA